MVVRAPTSQSCTVPGFRICQGRTVPFSCDIHAAILKLRPWYLDACFHHNSPYPTSTARELQAEAAPLDRSFGEYLYSGASNCAMTVLQSILEILRIKRPAIDSAATLGE